MPASRNRALIVEIVNIELPSSNSKTSTQLFEDGCHP